MLHIVFPSCFLVLSLPLRTSSDEQTAVAAPQAAQAYSLGKQMTAAGATARNMPPTGDAGGHSPHAYAECVSEMYRDAQRARLMIVSLYQLCLLR